jgi:hypothetical protein
MRDVHYLSTQKRQIPQMKELKTLIRKFEPINHTLLRCLFILMLGSILGACSMTETQPTDRTYLTSIDELQHIRRMAYWRGDRGIEPYQSLVREFLAQAGSPDRWTHGKAGGEFTSNGDVCVSEESPDGDRFINQQGGAQGVYQKMIAYYLTQNIDYARIAREKILEATTTYGFGGSEYSGSNQCILYLAFAIPLWIQAADLLEGSPIWTDADRTTFQAWLRDQVYPKVAWASRVRRNNWGSAGSLSASMIGDYLTNTNMTLIEHAPEYRELTPLEAYNEHNDMQLQRMNTVWKGDSRCDIWGIQPYGGIPDELRRGITGCEDLYLDDNDDSFVYQITQIESLVFHAEFLRRRGDYRIYTNVNNDGSGSLLKAILYIIDNPIRPDHSYPWEAYRTGVLSVAYYFYGTEAIHDEIYTSSLERGGMIAYGQLTHPLLEN